ncbi:hypothetical protein A5855_001648, partial [Enterococcus faecium]
EGETVGCQLIVIKAEKLIILIKISQNNPTT